MNTQIKINGLQHIGLPTNNLSDTIRFYEGLGFTVSFRTVVKQNDEKVAFLKTGNLVIECYENGCAAGRAGAWDHICFDVPDIEETFRLVKSLGYKLLNPEIQQLPFWDRGVRFFTIEGINGEKLEFGQIL